MKVALISLPWPLFNRPSIQLGVLKAYLRERLPEIKVKCFHPYLWVAAQLGYETYHRLSESSWPSEAIGAGLLFPSRIPLLEKVFPRMTLYKDLSYSKVLSVTKKALENYLKTIPWEEFQVVGFSVCLNQLTLTLWAAKELKRQFPHLRVVLGGALCAEDQGRGYLKAFPFIDFVINGEGERPFKELLEALRQGKEDLEIPGVFRRKGEEVLGGGFQEIEGAEIPSPDYSDYLKELSRLPPSRRFFPLISLETSRGCWWGKCRFCNLNLQWHGYRRRPLSKVLSEIEAWVNQGFLDFAFLDNCLDRALTLKLFEALRAHGRDYQFFAELRAIYTASEYRLMRQGGLKWVQIGIEALSTSLLRRLGKGTTAMANVRAMRHCEEVGLELSANLICHFPGSTPQEVEETLEALDFVFPFRPLSTVSFWLGYGSPVWASPRDWGLKRIYPHPFFSYLFPEELRRQLRPLIWSYVGDRRYQQRLWRPVIKKVETWRKRWSQLRAEKGPLLTYRDGGSFVILRQVTPEGKVLHHRLQGLSREIYLFLTEPRSFSTLKKVFPQVPEDRLRGFLKDLKAKKLLFQEGERFLALAIRPLEG